MKYDTVGEYIPFCPQDDTELFSDIDLDKDGFVSFKEFAVLVCTIAGCQHEVLQKAMEEQQKAKE